MNCKNCGARLDENSSICPNCGIKTGEFVLFAGDGRSEFEEENFVAKKKNPFVTIVSIILSIAILAGGGYFALSKYLNPPKPEMTFESGYGIINGDQPVIYVTLGDNAQLEYIHGVNLYAYDKSEDGSIGEVLTSDYEYTKSVDGTFRTIFFDASEFDVEPTEENTYTFEMSFSFVDNSKIYVYTQTVDFPNQITNDASEIVFDHSMEVEKTTQPTTEPEQTTEAKDLTEDDIKFLQESFWFMPAYTDNESYSISSIAFKGNGNCEFTHYYMKKGSSWRVTNSKGTYEIKGSAVFVTDSEGKTESYTVDADKKTVSGLEQRKYNSTKNAEDFFGI